MTRRDRLSITVLMLALLATPAVAADREAAERQYKIARRLAAEGSVEAASALRRVVELDPDGALADDATVELALLEGIPHWPEEIGNVEVGQALGARDLLDRVADREGADRTDEAKFHRALLRLEPIPGHDASKARVDLISIATAERSVEWAARARYALAWLHGRQGHVERSAAAYQRVIVDYPDSPAASRARVGAARVLLRKGRHGAAARMLQDAIESGAPPETQVAALRELAVRGLLQEDKKLESTRITVPTRNPCCVFATPEGGLLVGDRRKGSVIRLDPAGVVRDEWSLDDLQAVAIDFFGNAYAAAGAAIYRLHSGGSERKVAPQGDFAPVSAFAAADGGTFWIVDRRGQRVGRVAPGGDGPQTVWSGRDTRIGSVAWDGERLVGIDLRARTVVTLDGDGSLQVLVGNGLTRPVQLSADPTGRLTVLDVKAERVHVLNPQGQLLSEYLFDTDALARPSWAGLGLDGTLHVFDTADGVWIRRP